MAKRNSSRQRALKQDVTLEILPLNAFQSFRCFRHDYPSPGARYCVHAEYEVHLIRKGTGHYKIGGQLGKFKAGQVSIVGSRVPHDWVSDLRPKQVIKERDVVIQFSREWVEKVRKVIPEMMDVEPLLLDAQKVIIFSGASAEQAGKKLEEITKFTGVEQVAKLLEILSIMSKSPEGEREYVLEDPFATDSTPKERLAAENGVQYIFNNIDKRIRLADAAKMSYMSEATFSRFFKRGSGMSFSEMIRELRIEHGCDLLTSTEKPISTIAKECGFDNLSNFNRQFLKVMGKTPRTFRNLPMKEKSALLQRVFGHKNQILQNAKIAKYMSGAS